MDWHQRGQENEGKPSPGARPAAAVFSWTTKEGESSKFKPGLLGPHDVIVLKVLRKKKKENNPSPVVA